MVQRETYCRISGTRTFCTWRWITHQSPPKSLYKHGRIEENHCPNFNMNFWEFYNEISIHTNHFSEGYPFWPSGIELGQSHYCPDFGTPLASDHILTLIFDLPYAIQLLLLRVPLQLLFWKQMNLRCPYRSHSMWHPIVAKFLESQQAKPMACYDLGMCLGSYRT